MYFGVVSPGSTKDNISHAVVDGLKDGSEYLPPGLFGLAYTAYTLKKQILIPFIGPERCDPAYNAFKDYLLLLEIFLLL